MRKRIVSLIMVLMMVLSSLPVPTFAAESNVANSLDTSNLTFDVSNPAGYVTVSFADNGIRPEDATIDNVELYGTAVGTIIQETEVPYEEGDSVADVTVRLLDAMKLDYDTTGTVENGFYLAALENFELNGIYYPSFGEFDAGSASGWCVRVNNWHINQGSAAVEVEDGDVINWLYTCQYGADIGADFSTKSAEITDVVLSDSTLRLIYDEEADQYNCTVPEDISSIAFEVMLENYASVVTVTVDGETVKYRPNKAISVTNNSTIVISAELEYMDAENNNEVTTYTDSLTIQLQSEKPNNAPVVSENAPDVLEAVAGEEISVDLSNYFSDADGDALTYSVKCETLGIDQTLAGSVFIGTVPNEGTYEVVITVSDGKDSVSHTITLTVSEAAENTAPNIKAEYAETNSHTYIYSSSYVYIYMDDIFEDADGDTLTYKATLNGEEVEIAYNTWNKEYYIQFATKPAVYEYKIVANDGKADSEVFTAKCIGTSATITAPEDSPLINGNNNYYYISGSADNDTFTMEYELDVDEELETEWISSNGSLLVSNGDGSFTAQEIPNRSQIYTGVTCGKDGWGSPLYLGTRYINILPAMPDFADVTASLAEHEDQQIATVSTNAVSGGWYSNEFEYTIEDPSICDIAISGSYGLSVTPKALGSTEVTATFKYDESITCSFTVTVTGRSLQIKDQPDSEDVIYADDKTVQLEVLGAEEGETFTWSSADESVATVNDKGLVTIHALGQTYITAVSSLSTEEVPLSAAMYLQVKKAGKVYLDDIAMSDYSYFEGFISAKSGFNSAQLTYDWSLSENRYTYNKLAFTPYYDDENLTAVMYYQVSGGEYQTMELTDGKAVSITNGLNPGDNVVKIEVYPKDNNENVTTYTFNIFRPYNPSNTISRMTIYPNGENALAYPTYKDNKEGTLFQWDTENNDFIAGWNSKPSTGWSSSRDTYKTFVFGSRTSSISVYPTFAYAGQRVMIYVDGEEFEEAVTNWKSKSIPVDADGTVITFHVNSEKYHAEQLAAGVEDPFAEPEKVYTIYVESVEPLGIDAQILSAELENGEFYAPGFTSTAYTISGLIPNGVTDTNLTFTVPAGIDVYKSSVSDANKLTAAQQDEDGNNVYTTPIVTITGTGMYAYSTTNIILQVMDEEGNIGKTQYAFTISQRGEEDIYPDRVVEYLCIGSQYTNASSYGTMPERTLKNGGGVLSLGNFGGYIVYQYDTPIENNPENPYGVDFVIYGNSFGNGGHEPGCVQVSVDGETWYTLAGSDHFEDHNDWDYSMTYTNNNGKSAWSNSDGESGEIYNYPSASSYPYYTWTEEAEKSITVTGPKLNSTAKDAYGSAAAVLPEFGYVDVNTNGTINGTAVNPYDHPDTITPGGDQFDLDWAVDENGMPVKLESISYIRVATASSIYAGALGEKSTEVTAVYRVTNPADENVGETTAPTVITVNGNEVQVPVNGGVTNVELEETALTDEEIQAVLTIDVTAVEDANIYINGEGGSSSRSYTAIPEKGIIRIIVQEGEKEPYIAYLTINGDGGSIEVSAVDEVIQMIDTIGEVTLDKAEAIEAARAAYEALTEDEKAQVRNYETLIAAEEALAALRKENTADPIQVYVTISDSGNVKAAMEEITVCDLNADGGFNVDEVLYAAHEELYEGGAAAGYSSKESAYGLSITKLWGDESGCFGYWLNNASCWSLADPVEAGDYVSAFVYCDKVWWSDTYAKFDQLTYICDTEVTVQLFAAGYDENWNTVFAPYAGAEITVEDADSSLYSVMDNGDGTYTIVFDETGVYTVIATDGTSLVPTVCKVTAVGNAEDIYITTGDYLEALAENTGLAVGSVGGEWAVIGLARAGREMPAEYYDIVVDYVESNINANEQLHRAKSTENSRVILALTALGYDVTDVKGHNLLEGLSSMSYLKKQGINGPIWALIAFDSGNYEIPDGDVTREGLIDYILESQLDDGGWALSGTQSDVDMTAMAIQALALYYDSNAEVKAAVDKALEWLSKVQLSDGSYISTDGYSNAESCAQVIVALTALGIDPQADARFVKNGNSAIDALCRFYVEGGGFRHDMDKALDGMATEQGYYALAAYFRFLNGQTSLYDMSDVQIQENPENEGSEDKENSGSTEDSGNGSNDDSAEDSRNETADDSESDSIKTDTSESPKTGDSMGIMGPMMGMMISAAGLLVVIMAVRKRKA